MLIFKWLFNVLIVIPPYTVLIKPYLFSANDKSAAVVKLLIVTSLTVYSNNKYTAPVVFTPPAIVQFSTIIYGEHFIAK